MQADGSRALRTLVAEMAQLGDDDLQAILDDLDSGSRARLVEMIDGYRHGDTFGPQTVTAVTAGGLTPGDWLLARLQPRNPEASGMTPHALQALRRVALDSGWLAATVVPDPAPDQRGLLARLGLRP